MAEPTEMQEEASGSVEDAGTRRSCGDVLEEAESKDGHQLVVDESTTKYIDDELVVGFVPLYSACIRKFPDRTRRKCLRDCVLYCDNSIFLALVLTLFVLFGL